MCLYPITIKGNTFPCGKCVECKMRKSTEWAYRIMLECQSHETNMFITLTYKEEHLPDKGNLSRRDLTLFLKRLRKKIGKFRYFACGEYGAKKQRPHYHIIIFGNFFPDLTFYCNDNKNFSLYRSETLEKLWTKGYSCVGEVTIETAKYCAKYLQKTKKLNGKIKPFLTMSLKPGIGYNAINIDMLKSDKIYHKGKYISTPKYFLSVLKRSLPSYVEEVLELRRKKAKQNIKTEEWYNDLEERRKIFLKKFGYTVDK